MGAARRRRLDACSAELDGPDGAVLQVYVRCALNPGGALDGLAEDADKALETSNAGAIWFTRWAEPPPAAQPWRRACKGCRPAGFCEIW